MQGRASKVAALTIAALLLGSAISRAELTERGDLFVRFSGGIVPTALPRDLRAPIAVRIAARVRTLSGQRPPALRRIAISINGGGRLDTQGLPVCRREQLEPASSGQALKACRPALVGEGRYVAALALPGQGDFPSRGRILAFNAMVGGHRAILAHVYNSLPVPISRIVVFHVSQVQGTFGTVLTASLPASENRYGYLRRISLDLHRNFLYRGREHSYLSAACDAPAGFSGALFPFARASMTFSDGRTLASTLTRSCRVRGEAA